MLPILAASPVDYGGMGDRWEPEQASESASGKFSQGCRLVVAPRVLGART
jgi:hypothetical protein